MLLSSVINFQNGEISTEIHPLKKKLLWDLEHTSLDNMISRSNVTVQWCASQSVFDWDTL